MYAELPKEFGIKQNLSIQFPCCCKGANQKEPPEYQTVLPTMVANEITPSGTIGGEIAEEPADMRSTFVRSVTTGVILNYDNARNLHAWLGEKIKELEFLQQGKGAVKPGTKEFGH